MFFTQRSAPAAVEDDVDLFEDEPQQKPVAAKPAAKPAKGKPGKGAAKSVEKPVEKVWNNKAECDDAEKKLQERLAQVTVPVHYKCLLFYFFHQIKVFSCANSEIVF